MGEVPIVMNNTEAHMRREGPARTRSEEAIQPLREVGTTTKSQYWTYDDIEDAIREANLLGIDPQTLFGTASPGRDLII